MHIKFSDEKIRNWWESTSVIERMRLFGERFPRPGAYRMPWTKLHENERQQVRAEWRAGEEVLSA